MYRNGLPLCLLLCCLCACSPARGGPDLQATAVAATVTAAVPTPAPVSIDELRPLFDYDAEAPLDVEEVGVEQQDGIAVHDVSYASPMGGRVTAYLVVPPGEGPFAGVLFAHPGGGDRSYFLDEAVTLTRAGAVSVLVDAPWARPEPWQRQFDYTPENDRAVYIQDVVDLRRAVDLLVEREEVDPERIGFVGYSYGAHTGGVLSGVETRIRAYALVSGIPRQSDRIPWHIASTLPVEDLVAYLEAIRPLDAVNYVGHAAPAALLFQCGREDEIVGAEDFLRYYEAGSQPKQILWYDAGHRLNEQAQNDRDRWLGERLGLDLTALE